MQVASRSRWLRLVLAVLALVASQVSIAHAAIGATCPRDGKMRATSVVDRAPAQTATPDAHQSHAEAPHQTPSAPAVAPQCATSMAAVPPLPVVPVATITLEMGALPRGPEARLQSRAPSPPFRPPRAI